MHKFNACLYNTLWKKYADFTRDNSATTTEFRRLQLLVQLFNESHRTSILLVKMFCSSACILFATYGVNCFNENQFLGLLNIMYSVYGICGYMILYDKAFSVPVGISKLKRQLLVGVATDQLYPRSDGTGGQDDRLVKAVVRSFPNLSIRVGCFTSLQRLSGPEFFKFVGITIARLLVALR